MCIELILVQYIWPRFDLYECISVHMLVERYFDHGELKHAC